MAKKVCEMTNEEVLAHPSRGCGPKWPAWFTIDQCRKQLEHEELVQSINDKQYPKDQRFGI